MMWIDWATLAIAVYAALVWTLVAIRQHLRIRVDVNRALDYLKPPSVEFEIQAGAPVCWDASLPWVRRPRRRGCCGASVSGETLEDVIIAAEKALSLDCEHPVDPRVVK